ncbi:glycoside hydrolase family 3 N-terminal domain-containing protein [Mucilaginibacter koreensis]
MKKITLSALLLLAVQPMFAQKSPLPAYKNKNAPVESRVQDLLRRMTLHEKVLQLTQATAGSNNNVNNVEASIKAIPDAIGSLIYFGSDPVYRNQIQKKAVEQSRLGIPILFGYDVIHGFRTLYPVSIAQASSFNTDLASQACAVAAKEAKLSGIDWTFSPMIDVARDPRWGRVMEGYGEDPYTNGRFAAASVQGYQGKSLTDPYSIAACLKHYVGYGLSEGGRDYHYADVSPQSMWETYLPPYLAGIKAGAVTIMSGFNDISGTPASANYYTLTEILKNRWGFKGFVVSDWGSVEQLIPQGVAADRKEAGQKALMAGVDMDMSDRVYQENLEQLVKDKKVTIARIDDAVKRILRIKFQLGLFEHPYTQELQESQRYLQLESRAVAQKMAEETMVLLKNSNQTLPLKHNLKQIAIIGPIAKDQENISGAWNAQGRPAEAESVFEGLQKEFGNGVTLNYAKGCDFEGNDQQGFEAAAEAAQKSDVIILCLGEKRAWTGENTSRSTIALPAIQEQLLTRLKSTGKPIVLILSNGRPLDLSQLEPKADAIVEMWQPGIAGGTPVAGILSGRINPSGKLPITFPMSTGQIPIYYDMRQSARPNSGKYQDISTNPLYWFGYGLSYTTYQYSPVKLSASTIKKTQKLVAEVEVANTGSMAGKETVLWYISDPAASISRPMKELKYFEKKQIEAGKSVVYRFEIDPIRDLSFPDADGKMHLEAGDFYIHAGEQKIKFQLTE